MTDRSAFDDDVLVDTLLMELASLLGRLIEHGEESSIDLRAMPLSPACITMLEQRLGRGEVTAVVLAAGRSDVHETEFPGVWWSRHEDEAGRLIALLCDVTEVPPILRSNRADMAAGLQRLPNRTHLSAFAAAHLRPVPGQ
jgi:hydrogenase-1 operon protein HyaF